METFDYNRHKTGGFFLIDNNSAIEDNAFMVAKETSLVIQVTSPLVIQDSGKIDSDILYQMFDVGLQTLADGSDYPDYLRLLLADKDTIGLKVNTLGGPGISTHPEAVHAFSGILADCGVAAKNQLIWDRSDQELSDIGYRVVSRGDGPYCFGTDHQGVGYDSELVSNGKVGGLLSRILTEYCGAIVNFPVLKDHGVAGITGALKNHYGSIHNPNKYHGNGCDPYIADLNAMEQIKSKQRLIVMDALKIQFHGGPAYQKRWAVDFGGLLFSADPVAIDTIGYSIIERLRQNAGLEPIRGSRREPAYLKTAAQYGLGNNEFARITVKEIKI